MSGLFESLIEYPIFPTSSDLDGALTISLYLLVFVATVSVMGAFRNGWETSGIESDESRAGRTRARRVYFFLFLALVTFYVQAFVKFEHNKMLFGPWRMLAASVEDLKNTIRQQARKHSFEEMPNGLPGRAYKPNFEFTDIFPSTDVIQRWSESAKGVEAEALRYLHGKLPLFEQDWLHSSSTWDHFKMLAANPSRFWWLQQWFSGYLAWTLFVAMESRSRDISASAAISLVVLAYLTGLASMQCLFFALPLLLAQPFADTSYRLFNLYQGSLLLLPTSLTFLVHRFPNALMQVFGRGVKAAKYKRRLTCVWYVTSVVSIALHWYSTYRTFSDGKNGALRSWFPFNLLQDFRGDMRRSLRDFKGTWHSIFGVLGDYYYVNALGFDVLLSAFALGCWAVVGGVDGPSMLKCSLWPWGRATSSGTAAKRAQSGRRSSRSRPSEAEDIPSWANESGTVIRRRHATVPTRLDRVRQTVGDDEEDVPTPRRGRPPKDSVRSRSRSQARVISQSPKRARSQSRSFVSPVKRNGSSSRRSISRPRGAKEEWDSEWEMGSLKPTVESVAGKAEAAAVTWGVFAIGGLGAASAAVFGAEEVQI